MLYPAQLEEQRRDNLPLPSWVDHEAADMPQPTDHDLTLSLIKAVADQR